MSDLVLGIADIGFWVCLGLTLFGLVLAGWSFWKYDIRNVYMIRSGKARQISVSKMQEKNQMTGKLRDDMDFDYTQDTMITEDQTAEHSGDTGEFRTETPSEMPAAQKRAYEEASMQLEGRETSVLVDALETAVLDKTESPVYNSELAAMFREENNEGNDVIPDIPFDITMRDLVIHTKEIIGVR